MRMLLFDIDGTLLITDSGGKGALERAMSDEFQLESVDADIEFAGRTDFALFTELLHRNGIEPSQQHRERLARRYSKYLPSVLEERGGEVLPGVTSLLEDVSNHNGSRCYVMTGNLAETATHKLRHFGLLHYFDGVFGGDHDSNRDDLARRTQSELTKHHGEARRIVVIGDTPHDVRCGHAIGAEVIAVCTGSFGRDALEAESPAAVYDDLTDSNAIKYLLN